MIKQHIQEISDTKQCFGCSLCIDVCHTSAISFKKDFEGFFYPQVDESLCTLCTECYRKCPVTNDYSIFNFPKPSVYAAWNKDSEVVENSTSGGAFSAIAEEVFSESGVVYGARFDENMNLSHSRASNMDEIKLMRGSKYLQSNCEGVFKDIKSDLKKGLKVLFVGVPCQTAAAKTQFKKKENLLIVDIVCHGVNSPGVFKKYTEYIEDKFDDKLVDYKFRDKSKGWMTPKVRATFLNKSSYSNILDMDPFISGFRKNLYLRESCYNCKFTTQQRTGDITIGDFWGVPKEYFNKKGVSLLLINSKKGESYFNKIDKNLVFYKSDFETAKKKNPQLCRPSSISLKNKAMREEFFLKLNRGESKSLFNLFIFGKPFPRLRKIRYLFVYLKKRFIYR